MYYWQSSLKNVIIFFTLVLFPYAVSAQEQPIREWLENKWIPITCYLLPGEEIVCYDRKKQLVKEVEISAPNTWTLDGISFRLWLGANGADLGSTLYARGKYGTQVHELNPALRPLIDSPFWFGVAKMGVAASAGLLFQHHSKHARGVERWVIRATMWSLTAGMSYVAWRNTHLSHQLASQ